jgi:hypothetical protein
MPGVQNVAAVGTNTNRLVGLRITTGGDMFPTPLKAVVKHNRWFQANTFEAVIGLYGSPYDLEWWGSMDRVTDFPMEIEFGVGDPANGFDGMTWQQMMAGVVDKIVVDTTKGTVTCHGRDNVSLLIDKYTLNAFPDWTVKQICDKLISDVGLVPDVEGGDTGAFASELYRRDAKSITSGGQFNHLMSYWDIICLLALRANCFVYLDLDTLHVRPDDFDPGIWEVTMDPPDDKPPVVILNPSNTTKIVFERDLNIARNTSVIVRSWDAQGKGAYIGTDKQSKDKGLKSHTIQHIQAGIQSNEDADNRAEVIYNEAIRHEKKIHWSEPGDLLLTVLQRVSVVPSGATEWNQLYYLESIDRTMDWKTGFTMKCIGTNADPLLASILDF